MRLGEFETDNIYLGDSYELIKKIPDKSIDLIYTDIPYLILTGGSGSSHVSRNIARLQTQDLKDIRNGIDYNILNEFCRIMKHIYIYIYIYGAVKNKF